MQSTRLAAATIALALLTTPGLLGDRDAAAFVLLAGLAAIAGGLVVARPLADLAEAVLALARDKSGRPNHQRDMQRDDVVALQPQAQGIHLAIAAVESASGRNALGVAIATGNPAVQRRYTFTRTHAVGTCIDIVIPSDRRA